MEIRWTGNSTFEVRSTTGIVIVDHEGELPAQSELEDENTVFVYSKGDHTVHPTGQHHVLTGPGEYEIGGLSIRGVATPADDPAISNEVNTVYVVDADGLQVATLGNPGYQPSAQSVQQIGSVDVLILNSDSQGLEPDELSTVIRNLEPKMVVPSGYDTESSKPGAAMARLLTELGVKNFEPTPRLTVSKTGLPDERTVVVLQPRPA
ncbi:MAG: MBL fold metallo-hydrolase [Chloroflexi bacterium]|nr:MBL fold metallo-hydrolase [Chloroflexota bacterium]